MLALDETSHIRWINDALLKMTELEAEALIGHDRDSLPNPAFSGLFDGQGLLPLPTEEITDELWVRCTSSNLQGDGMQGWRLHCYTDVTENVHLTMENQRLQREVASLEITDPLTGFPNKKGLLHGLEMQVSRSRRYNNPLSLIQVRPQLAEPADEQINEAVLLATANFLRNRMRWVDQVGRWNQDSFTVVLPETELAAAESVAQGIANSSDNLKIAGVETPLNVQLLVSVTGWQQGDDALTLVKRALNRLPTA